MTNNLLNTSAPVQFSRGELLMEHIDEYSVPVLEFPFYDVLDILYATRNKLREADGKKWIWDNAPTDSLNEFLLYLSPALAHPFVINYRGISKQLDRSRIYQYPMFAIGIPQRGKSVTVPEPIPEPILKQVMKIWLREVAVPDVFNGYTGSQTAADAVKEAEKSISDATVQWKLIPIAQLLQQRRENTIGYGALQSLLAVMFIQQANQSPITLSGQEIEWRAMRKENHFEPVSQHIAHKSSGDVFAYHLSIELRDMPGRDRPLVYVVPHMRRYISRKVVSRNDERDIRVMVEYPTPLSKHIPELQRIKIQSPLHITGKLRSERDKSTVKYRNHLPKLIRTFLGGAGGKQDVVVNPFDLLTNPKKYRTAKVDWRNAVYLPLLADGIDQSGKTKDLAKGLPLDECVQILEAFNTHLQGWYQPDKPLCRLDSASFTVADIYDEQQPIKPLFWIGGVHDKIIWLNKQPKVPYRILNLPEHIPNRLKLALDGKKLVILLIANTENAHVAMEDVVRGVIGCTSREEALQDNVEVKHVITPQEIHHSVVNWNSLYDVKESAERRNRKDAGWREDVRRIQQWIEDAKLKSDSNATYLAVIERPPEPTTKSSHSEQKQDNAKKSTLRAAFGLSGIRTQMIREFPHDDEIGLQNRDVSNMKWHKGEQLKQSRSRLEHAVANGVILHSGMTYGAPQELYEALGFEPELSQSIVVEYWVRVRSTSEKTDFIAVARKLADGYVEVVFPDVETGEPMPALSVHDANLYLQCIFSKNDKKYRSYTPNKHDDRLRHFFRSMLEKKKSRPTVLVMNVTDWNWGGTKWLGDLEFRPNELCIEEGEDPYIPQGLKNVRIVKMLVGDRFNMRYWESSDGKSRMIDELAAIYDEVATIPTLYSIAPQLRDYDEKEETQSNAKAGKEFFQRSRVIEFAGAMMQQEDNSLQRQLAWCAIPHLDRINPAWKRGATVYPHPYHLLGEMVSDALWASIGKL